ncbi:hypothetical protein SDJN02_10896, partial [Cucurbita argyrosperma subsp. argyrosperma]
MMVSCVLFVAVLVVNTYSFYMCWLALGLISSSFGLDDGDGGFVVRPLQIHAPSKPHYSNQRRATAEHIRGEY